MVPRLFHSIEAALVPGQLTKLLDSDGKPYQAEFDHCIDMWRLYARLSTFMPNVKRLENLYWRVLTQLQSPTASNVLRNKKELLKSLEVGTDFLSFHVPILERKQKKVETPLEQRIVDYGFDSEEETDPAPFKRDMTIPDYFRYALSSQRMEYYPEKKQKKKRKEIESFATDERVCSNCQTSNTPSWRFDPNGYLLCNACALYAKWNGKNRPTALFHDPRQRRKRVKV